MLLLFTGLPGTGKSTLAKAYQARHGGLYLNSDAVRSDLGLRGQYGASDKQKVYDEMLRRARAALLAGENVLIDSTLYRNDLRRPYLALASELGIPLYWIELRAGERDMLERVGRPRPDSEADPAVLEQLKSSYEPIATAHLSLWTGGASTAFLLEAVEKYTGIGSIS